MIKKLVPALIVSLPMIYNLNFFIIAGNSGIRLISSLIFSVFTLFILIQSIYTGKVYKYRALFFIVIALGFFPSFIKNLIEVRGQVALDDINIINNEVPFCQLLIPFTVIPYALTETLIFPAKLLNSYASLYSMLFIWLLATLLLGRGWCSWVCFYGGWDELFSKIGKKRYIKTNPESYYIRYFNYIILLFILLVSLKTLSVAYCEWFCPFKLITEYADPGTFLGFIQFILMVVAFFVLLIVLPFLTKKRFQCTTFCPLGAFQSLFNKISLYSVVIDSNKCSRCKKCIKSCPTSSITNNSIDLGKPCISCTLCFRCIDECPKGAISSKFSFFKKQLTKDGILYTLLSPKTFITFTGLFFGSMICSSFIIETISMLIEFAGGIL